MKYIRDSVTKMLKFFLDCTIRSFFSNNKENITSFCSTEKCLRDSFNEVYSISQFLNARNVFKGMQKTSWQRQG